MTTPEPEKQPGVCGKPCEIWSRVVGYLRPVQQWNKGKVEEYADRVVYRVDMTPEEIDASIVRRFGHI